LFQVVFHPRPERFRRLLPAALLQRQPTVQLHLCQHEAPHLRHRGNNNNR